MFITVYVGMCAMVLHVEVRGQLYGVGAPSILKELPGLQLPGFLCWSGVHVNVTFTWERVGAFTQAQPRAVALPLSLGCP